MNNLMKKENTIRYTEFSLGSIKWMVNRGDVVGGKQVQYDNQVGRSMVEMLGVLSIIGVLSVSGVAMYASAMNKHRANELLNEATKRAINVASQILMNGKDATDTSVAEFVNPKGYTFGVVKKNVNQFNITINAVDDDICTQMKAAIGSNTLIRKINTMCTELTFNNDMSTTVFASDFETESTCTEAGNEWCSDSKTSGICAPMGTDCCTVLNYDNACQTCTNGVLKDDYNLVCQNCNGTYSNGVECTTANKTIGVCEDGYCKPVNEMLLDKDCITQMECGGIGSGYFCYYNGYNDATKCTEDPATAMGCEGTTTAVDCLTQNSSAKKGQCKKVSAYFHSSNPSTKIEGLGYLSRSAEMNWWSAVNWCQGQGKSLFNLHNPIGNRLQCNNEDIGTGTTIGRCCSSNYSSCTTEATQQSHIMQLMRRSDTLGTSGNLWTQNSYSTCLAFYVSLKHGIVNANYRSYINNDNGYGALCE